MLTIVERGKNVYIAGQEEDIKVLLQFWPPIADTSPIFGYAAAKDYAIRTVSGEIIRIKDERKAAQ